jgi:hypothetical protein
MPVGKDTCTVVDTRRVREFNPAANNQFLKPFATIIDTRKVREVNPTANNQFL